MTRAGLYRISEWLSPAPAKFLAGFCRYQAAAVHSVNYG